MTPSRIKILVVEDDPILRKMIASLFTKFADVKSLESGHAAITYLKDNAVDLVFSDVCMPDGGGLELLAWSRENLTPAPTVILVTGQSSLNEQQALELGAHALVAKPFKVRDLLAMAREFAEKFERQAS